MVGFIGAFTIFSTFKFETFQWFRRGGLLVRDQFLGLSLLWAGGEVVARS
ncbi:MAG: hypothetical protein ACRD2E_12630 [Terriglobales bacterium]